MAMTLEISSDMETLLRLSAAKQDQDVEAYLLKLVQKDLDVDLSEHASLEDYASPVAGIQAGLEDVDAGRLYTMEEVFGHLEEHRAERRKEKAAE